MKLRTQLSLFFGSLIVAVLTLVVSTNYHRLYESLEQGLEQQFSLDPYQQVTEVERTLLLERANALVDRPTVLNGVRRINSILSDPEQGHEALEKLRTEPESEDFVLLNSTYEQMLLVLNRVEAADGQDLVVLASEDGTVIAEAFNEVIGKENPQELEVSVTSLQNEAFWSILSQFDSCRGYLVYPNKGLYLYGFSSFRSRFSYEGVAVVGEKVDRALLRSIVVAHLNEESGTAGETLAFVVYGDQVVASNQPAAKLGEELLKAKPSGDVWTSSSEQTFLVKSAPLFAYYLSDIEKKKFSELGLSDQLPSNTEVGRVYLLRDVGGIEQAAFEGARETLIMGGLALLLSLLAIPLMANRLTGPIEHLSKAMKCVGEGQLDLLPQADMNSSGITEVKEAAESFDQMVIGLRQKKVLEHFVPEGTRREVEERRGRTSELGGRRWERTIMFSDLRGFTSMSESMTPDEVMAVLNRYLHVMSKAIRLSGGDINEYIGDAILAVFEDPDRAVQAAVAMNLELMELRKDNSIEALAGLSQGIGLHTGPLVEGNIGELGRRMKRAVVGDTVNLAARIQDRSRDGSHSCIFLSQDTKDKLKGRYDLVHFGDESFKGKSEPVPVWEVKLS